MMNNQWEPSFKLDLMEVINHSSIKGLHVGLSDSLIYETMGIPELPAARIGKKSKVFSHIYGNVNILSEGGSVIAINIDFHSNRKKMVTIGEIGAWNMDDWVQLSKNKSWTLKNIDDVIQIYANRIIISLSQKGQVGLVSFR